MSLILRMGGKLEPMVTAWLRSDTPFLRQQWQKQEADRMDPVLSFLSHSRRAHVGPTVGRTQLGAWRPADCRVLAPNHKAQYGGWVWEMIVNRLVIKISVSRRPPQMKQQHPKENRQPGPYMIDIFPAWTSTSSLTQLMPDLKSSGSKAYISVSNLLQPNKARNLMNLSKGKHNMIQL